MRNMLKRGLVTGLTAAGVALASGAAMAAGTDAGVEAGFFALGSDLNTVLSGAGGYVILILSVIVAAATVVFTGRWGAAVAAFGVAVLLGYGLPTLSSFGSVTATIEMLEPMVIASDVHAPISVQ